MTEEDMETSLSVTTDGWQAQKPSEKQRFQAASVKRGVSVKKLSYI